MFRGSNRRRQKLLKPFPCRENVCDCNDENILGVSQTNPSDIVYIVPGLRIVSDFDDLPHRVCTRLDNRQAEHDSDKTQ